MPPGQLDSACLPPDTISSNSWVDASLRLAVSRRSVSAIVLSSRGRDGATACEDQSVFPHRNHHAELSSFCQRRSLAAMMRWRHDERTGGGAPDRTKPCGPAHVFAAISPFLRW